MTSPRIRPIQAGLALALASSIFASDARSQPMSSGSGSGTGTGMSGGAARNSTGTGMMGGSSGNTTGTGTESGGGAMLPGAGNYFGPSNSRGRLLSPSGPVRGGSVPMGPGATTNFPGEEGTVPLDALLGSGEGTVGLSTITDRHLQYALSIPRAADRSLTLSRVASAATFSNQLDLAEKALEEASRAALQMELGLVRDQRLISIITALMNLAEARLREGRGDIPVVDPASALAIPKSDTSQIIRRARLDWRRAADLATRIGSPTYKPELMYRVADSISFGSQSIVNEFPRSNAGDGDGKSYNKSFEGLPDELLQEAADLAAKIDRPAWHDRGLVMVASAAAESKQFPRALTTARMIAQPELRSNALLKIAETQARRNDADGATTTYREAALAIASVPLDDLRTVLAGVLIDNLISVGRFEDARASTSLYPDTSHKVVALGAIAEAQGKRGARASALAWINSDVPAEYRSALYRRLSDGVVTAIEGNRSRDLSNRGER